VHTNNNDNNNKFEEYNLLFALTRSVSTHLAYTKPKP